MSEPAPIVQKQEEKYISLEEELIKRNEECASREIYTVFHSIMSFIAIYLSYRCNRGFDLNSFLVACCCPYLYIIYTLATKGSCGIISSNEGIPSSPLKL